MEWSTLIACHKQIAWTWLSTKTGKASRLSAGTTQGRLTAPHPHPTSHGPPLHFQWASSCCAIIIGTETQSLMHKQTLGKVLEEIRARWWMSCYIFWLLKATAQVVWNVFLFLSNENVCYHGISTIKDILDFTKICKHLLWSYWQREDLELHIAQSSTNIHPRKTKNSFTTKIHDYHCLYWVLGKISVSVYKIYQGSVILNKNCDPKIVTTEIAVANEHVAHRCIRK